MPLREMVFHIPRLLEQLLQYLLTISSILPYTITSTSLFKLAISFTVSKLFSTDKVTNLTPFSLNKLTELIFATFKK